MGMELNDSFFIRFGKRFSIQRIEGNTAIPFKDHPQFPMIIDILSRKEKHHLFLCSDFSSIMHSYFLEALLFFISNEQSPAPLRLTELIYLNVENAAFIPNDQMNLEQGPHSAYFAG